MLNRRQLLRVTATSALFPAALLVNAQSKLTNVIVGFAPGGPGEVLARRIADEMGKALDRTFIVTNKPGAGGMLAAASLKGVPADGNTLVFSPPGIVTTLPLVNKKLPYDPSNIEPVAGICEFSFAFAVRADHPAKNLKEFAEWAKKQPQGSLYGVLGLGNMPHFIGYQFSRNGGFPFEPVGYKGAKEVVTDLLGGSLPSGINVTAGFAVEHRAGTLRVLGTTGTKRTALLPDVPTFSEQGFTDIVATESFGFYGPRGIPAQEADRIYKASVQALESNEVKQFMAANDFVPAPLSPQNFKAALQASSNRWVPVIKASGFQMT